MEDHLYTFADAHGIKPERAVDASAGISPLGPSGRAKAAIRKAAKDVGIPPDPRQQWLRRLFLSKFGIPAECLTVSASLDGLLYLVTRVLGPKKVVIAGPAPDIYAAAAAAAGGEAVIVPAFKDADLAPRSAGVIERLQGAGMLVLSNPNRITGRLMPAEEMGRMLDAAAGSGVVTVLDESLMEFTGGAGMFGPVRGRVVVLRTTSFFYGLPGLELACASAPADLAALFSAADHGAPSHLSVEAARAAYKDKTYRLQVEKFLSAEKALFQRSLAGIRGVSLCPSDSNVFLLRLEGDEAGSSVRAALAREGYFMRDCAGMEGLGETFLRLSVMGHGANRKFLRIIREGAGPSGRR